MSVKYYLSYTYVTKVTTNPHLPFVRIENVTMLQRYSPSTCQKPESEVSLLRSEVYWSLH